MSVTCLALGSTRARMMESARKAVSPGRPSVPSRDVYKRQEQRLTVNRARKLQQFLSQSFHVAEQFTGNPGVYIRVEDTVRSFAAIVDGECDDLPEQAFRYASTIDDVRERAAKMGEK